MRIIVNGNSLELASARTVAEVLSELEVPTEFVAVAVNCEGVLRRNYASTPLKENDELEILSPMQGG
jgi:sulfur carrier protein